MVRNVLNIKVLREIKNNFKTYLSVILIATLAVTLFTGIWANYMNFSDRLNHIYEEAHMCDGIITMSNYDEEVESYIKSKNVSYEKRIYLTTKQENNNIYLATFSNESVFNLPYQISTDELKDDMVFVDKNFLKNNHYEIGQKMPVQLPFAGNALTIYLEISGSMTHPESLENSNYNPAFVYVGITALKEAILEAINQPFLSLDYVEEMLVDYYNQFLIAADAGFFKEAKDSFEDKENFVYSLERSDLPSNMTVDADVNQAKMLIYIFPVIFYLVAVLIILTSISQLINRESKNIGLLKALGFSKREILFHYMKIFIMLGLIGSVLGMILGPLIVPNVMGKKYNLLYQLPTISLTFFRVEYLLSVVFLMIIIVLVSIFACYSSMGMVPAASLRGDNAVPMKISILNKLKWMKKIPLSILMAFRNMKRKISRTLMVILGVLGCSALLVCGFGIEDTIHYGIDLELEELIPYDVSVSYSNLVSRESDIKAVEGVSSVDEYAKYSISIEKDSTIRSYVYLLPEKSEVFKVSYGIDDCLISSKVAEEIGAKVGDQIRFLYQNNHYEVTITQIVDFCISQGIFLSKNRFTDIPFLPSGSWIKTTTESSHEVVSQEIEKIDSILSATTIEAMRIHAEDVIASIKVMTWTIKIFAILLALVVIYNLALLNFKERIKDIATLKVLGFSKFEIASSLIIEILFLTFVGAIIGLFLGYPLLVAVLSINENPLLSYIYHINFASYLWTVLITCGSSFIINLIFAFLTNKVQMVESLKSVE